MSFVFEVEEYIVPQRNTAASSDSDDSDGEDLPKKVIAVPVDFRCSTKKKRLGQGNLFMLDREGANTADDNNDESESEEDEEEAKETSHIDPQVKQALSRAVVKPGFEQIYGVGEQPQGFQAKKLRKLERGKTAGKDWFDMPATELTDENRRDLELLRMRQAINPTNFYKKNDRDVLPKFFQIGHVVDSPADFYAGRIAKKDRKRTMVDELLADSALLKKNKAKLEKIQRTERYRRQKIEGKKQKVVI